MNTITDKQLVGGMINSIGFQQQDYASITYMFKYLDNGLNQISFETADDFCIVLEEKMIIKVQVKINLLTVSFVKDLLKKISNNYNQVIIGSGYSDDFRNILQYKTRYVNSINGSTYTDKKKLNSDWEDYCYKKDIDGRLLLKCEFDSIDSNNQISIARDAIAQWAEKKNIYVDSNRLLSHLLSIVSEKRSQCGQLSKNDIESLVSQYRSPFRIPNYYSTPLLKSTINELEQLINEYPRFANDLLVIKNDIENNNLTGAKNRIEKIFGDKILQKELERTYLWTLNQLKDYNAVIAKERDYFCEDTHYEISLAYFKLHDLDKSARCLDIISKEKWSEDDYLLRAYIYMSNMENERALHELEQCLNINNNNVNALVAIGIIYMGKDQSTATDYFLKATSIDNECPDAYLGLATISECACDFELALQYYQKLEKNNQYELPSVILAKMGAYSYILKKDIYAIYFQKWNNRFRNENSINGEKKYLLFVIGLNNCYTFTLKSTDTGVSVFLFDNKILDYNENSAYIAISSIGVMVDNFSYQFNRLIGKHSLNPLRSTESFNVKDSYMPVIIRQYKNQDAFQKACSTIDNSGKVHLNHILSQTQRDYVVDEDAIDVELELNGKQLTGIVIIDNIEMPIWIDPIGEGFEAFRKELTSNKNFNEAALLLMFDIHEKIYYFPKSEIKIHYL